MAEDTRELIVVKFGSDSLGNIFGLNQERINSHAERVAPLHKTHDILIVTSGAVAEGKRRILEAGERVTEEDKQYLAFLGSAGVTVAWEKAFQEVDLMAGQVLITHNELRDTKEGPYFRKAYHRAKKHLAVPILNHNDFLSSSEEDDDELKEIENYADNDRLAKDVAIKLGAKTLFLATDNQQGLMVEGQVKRIVRSSEIEDLKEYLHEPTPNGSDRGMESKLENAAEAAEAGIDTYICDADADFAALMAGKQICTRVIQ